MAVVKKIGCVTFMDDCYINLTPEQHQANVDNMIAVASKILLEAELRELMQNSEEN